jgi:peptide/nickel transport system permease protein
MRRPPTAVIAGGALVGAFVVLAASSALAPYPYAALAGEPLTAPGRDHLLGTNGVGQDVASQLLAGTSVSVLVALAAGAGTVLIGALVGMTAGWVGGRVDAGAMRLVDVVLITPQIPLVIVVAAYAGPSLAAIVAVIALTSWPAPARAIRSQVLALRPRAHVRASVSFGAGTRHVLLRHVAPELGPLLAAAFVSATARAVMLEAGLAFLGLGDPNRASWGRMLRDAIRFDFLFETGAWAWWLLPPVLAISGLLLGLTLLGIGVERRFQPRLARHVWRPA